MATTDLPDVTMSDSSGPGGSDDGDTGSAAAPTRHRVDVVVWLSSGWLAIVVFAALAAPWLPLRDPSNDIDYEAVATGPSSDHWLGTDQLARDILSRLAWGGRVSIIAGLGSVLIGILIGGCIGLVAGYFRGSIDGALSWVIDVLLAFPGLVFALAIAAYLGPSLTNVTIAIAVIMIPGFARVARAATISAAERDFVLAARSLGEPHRRILFGELLPVVWPTIATYSFVAFAIAVIVEGGLSFLGLSVPPPTPSWGSMIAGGRSKLDGAVHVSLFPAIALFLTVLSLNMLGERFGDAKNSRGVQL